jgi:hypothetical protein
VLEDLGDKPPRYSESEARLHDLRGRDADYFLFSQKFIGSRITGFCRTANMYDADRRINLASAMAISGAAAAPNMGTSTVKPLVFIMTMLNVRLGYWLPNPRYVFNRFEEGRNKQNKKKNDLSSGGLRKRIRKALQRCFDMFLLSSRVGPLYLLLEMFGFLNEDWPFVNVSDGGHIENLGLYPLLQRKCRLIFAIDGERDPANKDNEHSFSGLATAIRHARIDLAIDADIKLTGVGQKDGRHFALGRIDYGPKFPHGWLVYIKSSITGDENTYIREYRMRKPSFPHEPTSDQFFDETQFECYRALGFHAAEDFLGRSAEDIEGDEGLSELLGRLVHSGL